MQIAKIAECPHCKSKYIFRNCRQEIECLNCGYVHYENPDFDMPLCRKVRKHTRAVEGGGSAQH